MSSISFSIALSLSVSKLPLKKVVNGGPKCCRCSNIGIWILLDAISINQFAPHPIHLKIPSINHRLGITMLWLICSAYTKQWSLLVRPSVLLKTWIMMVFVAERQQGARIQSSTAQRRNFAAEKNWKISLSRQRLGRREEEGGEGWEGGEVFTTPP